MCALAVRKPGMDSAPGGECAEWLRTGPRREPWNHQGTVHREENSFFREKTQRSTKGIKSNVTGMHEIKMYIT